MSFIFQFFRPRPLRKKNDNPKKLSPPRQPVARRLGVRPQGPQQPPTATRGTDARAVERGACSSSSSGCRCSSFSSLAALASALAAAARVAEVAPDAAADHAGAAAGLVAAAVPTLLEREEVARFASQVRDA